MDEATNATFARFINSGELDLAYYLGDTYILTHYLYAWVYWFFPANTLVTIHIVHTLWKCGTILALYAAGKKLIDVSTGLWAALFYAVYSICLFSKDFQTPSAESWSLLPAALCAGYFFKGLDSARARDFFIAGVMAALSTMFKAPAGVLIVAMGLTLLARGKGFLRVTAAMMLGFILTIFSPSLLVWPLGSGFVLMWQKLLETRTVYIQQYEELSFVYWGLKFLMRSAFVFICIFGMSVFAVLNFPTLFHLRNKGRIFWQKIFFLFCWFFLIWGAVSLGKRVFFHYYVFILAPLALLAGAGLQRFDRRLWATQNGTKPPLPHWLIFIRRHIISFMIVADLIAFTDGALNVSTQAPRLGPIMDYIRAKTEPNDRIYVWGGVPQIYFLSGRLPATTFFWSDSLAGTHPGSPAMEYVRATGQSLQVHELLIKDLAPANFVVANTATGPRVTDPMPHAISENELFTVDELIERINNPYWQRVMRDFIKHPPVLFVDTSPTNIRGFGHFPIHHYELLTRFLRDNYEFETSVDGMNVYRLNFP